MTLDEIAEMIYTSLPESQQVLTATDSFEAPWGVKWSYAKENYPNHYVIKNCYKQAEKMQAKLNGRLAE